MSSLNSFVRSSLGVVLSAIFGLLLMRLITNQSGVDGLAEFGIYRQFLQFCTVFLSWGNGYSLIQSYASADDRDHFVSQSAKYFQLITVLLSVLVAVLAKPLTLLLFNDLAHIDWILLSPLVFIGISSQNFFRFLLAARQALLSAGVAQALPFGLLCAASFLTQDLSSLFLVAYLVAAFLSWGLWKIWGTETITFSFKLSRLPSFEKTSLATILTGAVGFFCPLLVKSLSVHRLGLGPTGVLEAELSLVSYFNLAIISGLGTYYLGTVSSNPEDKVFRERIFHTLVPFAAASLAALVLLQDVILSQLFGEALMRHNPDLSVFGLAELLRCINWFFIFSMIGLSYRRLYMLIDTLANISYVILSLLLLSLSPMKESLHSSYLIFQVLYLVGSFFFCVRSGVVSWKRVLLTAGLSIACFAGIIYARNQWHG